MPLARHEGVKVHRVGEALHPRKAHTISGPPFEAAWHDSGIRLDTHGGVPFRLRDRVLRHLVGGDATKSRFVTVLRELPSPGGHSTGWRHNHANLPCTTPRLAKLSNACWLVRC